MELYSKTGFNRERMFKTRELGFSLSNGYNKVTGGAYRGQMHLYCACSGGGKTSTGVGTMMRLLKQGLSVLYVCMEEDSDAIGERMLKFLAHSTDPETCNKYYEELIAMKFEIAHPNGTIQEWGECFPLFEGYDAVIWDYIKVPEGAVGDSASISAALNSFATHLHELAVKNNQFIFAMAQGKGKPIEEDTIPFSDFDCIRLSSAMGQSCEVIMIARRINQDHLYIDYIKVRFPYKEYVNVRIRRRTEFAYCNWIDEAILDQDGNELEGLLDGTEGFTYGL